ncbi:phasin family protein [Paraburkholderia sediminicola]|jgi:phasin family protein|uniref:phasin family protein n=1 Tax=Paraburkholderia sediminicola TaxID=458836 RepID=UPI0038B89C88
MLKSSEDLSAAAKQQLDSSTRFAELSLDGAERLIRLQMDAARRALNESAEIASALTGTTDPQEIASLRTRLATKNTEALLSTSKEVYETAMQSRDQLMALLNQSLGGLGKDYPAAAQKAFASMSASESPLKALQTVMAAAHSAAEHLFKLASQATAASGFPDAEKTAPASGSSKKS